MILIFLLIVLVCLSGMFSASETALFSLSTSKVKTFKQDKDQRKQLIANLLASPRDLLVTILIVNISVNILIQNISASIFGKMSGWILNVGFPLTITLIFGEIIPKSIGFVNNTSIAYRMSPFLNVCQKLFLPIRKTLVFVTGGVVRVFFFFLKKEKEISIEELKHALKTSRKYGVLSANEAELVKGYLLLQESTVKEKMRPREDVLYFDIDEPLSKLIHLFVDQECSRIPICEEGLDKIIGIMGSSDFFLHVPKLKNTEDLRTVVKKPFFVPESIPAKVLLRQFYDRQESLAIVVDEYGSVSGLIALEDLVETVVGEISDRRDDKMLYTMSGSSSGSESGEDVMIASGKMELSEVEKIFDVPLESQHGMVTIGGYLTEKMGDIPKSGAKFVTEDFLFHVLSADLTRVRRVYIRRFKR